MYAIGNKEPKNNRNCIRNNETKKKRRYIVTFPQQYPCQNNTYVVKQIRDDKNRDKGNFVINGKHPIIFRLSLVERNIEAFEGDKNE